MSVRPKLLFVCRGAEAHLSFMHYLERAGCRLIVAREAEHAAKILVTAVDVDAILIHHEDITHGSTMGSGFKLITPLLPVLLLTKEWPTNGVLPGGVDALCYAVSLNRRVANDIARFVRYLLLEQPLSPLDDMQEAGRFIPHKPNYLN